MKDNNNNTSQFAGLELVVDGGSPLDQITRILATTLFDYGHHIERQSSISPTKARIIAKTCRIDIALSDTSGMRALNNEQAVEARHVTLEMLLTPTVSQGHDANEDHAQLLLVVMLYRLVQLLDARQVKWLDPLTILSTKQFCSAFAGVSPPRVNAMPARESKSAKRFTPIDEAQQQLGRQYEAIRVRGKQGVAAGLISVDHEAALIDTFRHDPNWMQSSENEATAVSPHSPKLQRATVWAMTLLMLFVSMPVAAAMAAVNLMRGEDLRLNTHILSYTALVTVANSTGAFAEAARVLNI